MLRFWNKVDVSGDCWLWTACTNKNGYGVFSYKGKSKLAHRVAIELTTGTEPTCKLYDHTCHTPACVRPEHLVPATHKRNMENRKGAQRNSKSGIRGVIWYKPTGKWRAEVRHNGKQRHLGYFDNIDDAEQAAIEGREKFFV